jgi:hypothetical protein
VRDRFAIIPGETMPDRLARLAAERARAAERAAVWATVSIGLASFSLGFALRGILDGLGS